MRLGVLALVLTVAFVVASVQMQRDACGRGTNWRRCLASLCKRRGGTFLPQVRGCRGCGACVKFLGLGEACADQASSTVFPQPMCSRHLRCDPETKRCITIPAPTTASNSTVASMKSKPRCRRKRLCFKCFCQRSRRPKLGIHNDWYNAYTNPNLHRLYR